MVQVKGRNTGMIFKLNPAATAYGTALAAGADKIRMSLSTNFNAQALEKNPIGSQQTMLDNIIRGRRSPILSPTMDLGFETGPDKILAQFFGAVTAAAEQTATEGDFLHRMTINEDANDNFATVAYETSSTTVVELPSVATTEITVSFGETDAILQLAAELLGNEVELSTAVNTNAVIQASTAPDTECAIATSEDTFQINVESAGALGTIDQLDVFNYSLNLTRPQSFTGVVRDAVGNAEPLADSEVAGTLSVTLQFNEDHTFFDAWEAETTFKSAFNVEGTVIGAGLNKAYTFFAPRMKLIQEPVYNITESGFNTVVLNFVLLQAAANPTGMDSDKPYVDLINERATDYLV